MKKKTIISILSLCLIAVLALGLMGCGKKEDPVESKSEKETTAPAETTAPEDSNLPTEDRMMQATVNAIYAFNEIGRLSSGGLEVDDSITYTDDNGYVYNYVTDAKYQNFGDISSFLNNNFTWDYTLENYPYLADPGSYDGVQQFLYLQEDYIPTGLYQVQGGKGYTIFDENADFIFTSVHEDYFCASFDYDNFGTASTATIEMVLDNGAWKIDNVIKQFSE